MNSTEERVAFISSQTTCALIEMESMKALNTYRQMRGETIAYDESAFLGIIDKYGLGYNDVILTLRGER